MEAIMNYKTKKRILNVALIFALIFSLIHPISKCYKSSEHYYSCGSNCKQCRRCNGRRVYCWNCKETPVVQALNIHTGPFSADTNLGLADSPTETDVTKIIPVQLPTGS